MQDRTLVDGFLAGTLDSFGHREHVRVAFLLLHEDCFDTAVQVFSDRIRAMAVAGGDPTKFHATRTKAWLLLVDEARKTDSTTHDSEAFLARHPLLLRSSLLDEYYSSELLRSDAARANYVEPDLAPLR
jgi:hypothetical protein